MEGATQEAGLAWSAYIFLMVALGLGVLDYSVYSLFRDNVNPQWLILACVTVIASAFPIKFSRANSKISIGDTFVFANLILFSPAAGALTASLDGFLGSIRSTTGSRRLHYTLFNTSVMALSAYLAGEMFFIVSGAAPLLHGSGTTLLDLIPAIGAMALTYYLLNSSAVAVVVALDTNRNIFQVWKKNFLWTSVTYFGGGIAAAILATNIKAVTPVLLGVFVPILVVIYFTYKTYADRVEENLHSRELQMLYMNTVEALALAIDAKDHATYGHARRVQILTRGLARAVGVEDEADLRGLETAALLHDIGNLAVPEYILNKPGKLTRSEEEKMMVHPVVGADILGTINFPYPVAKFVRHHHENWDGSGYPDGLKGEQIPLGARILAVADTYEALTGERPYQNRFSRPAAMARIRELAGIRFDPMIVRKFEESLEDLLAEVDRGDPYRLIHQHPDETDSFAAGPKHADSVHLKRSMVFEDISSAHKEVFALYEFAKTLGSSLDIREALTVITSKVMKLVPASTCVVYLFSPERNCLVAMHAVGSASGAFEQHALELEGTVSGWAAANRMLAVNLDPAPDLKLLKVKLASRLSNSLVVPLEFGGELLGTISLYSTEPDPYRDDHVRIMGLISRQVSTALHNALKFEATREDACTDAITGLPNARYLHLYFEQEREKSVRNQHPLTLMGMDLDGFKSINDTFGHKFGDQFLIEVGAIIRSTLRGSDLVVRYSGDEFVAVLPQTGFSDARLLAERVQEAIDALAMEVSVGRFARAGISIGLATFPLHGETLDELLEKADREMYRNKSERKFANGYGGISDEAEPKVPSSAH